ncbi:ABC transporter ATP-binding protein [Streptomyces sp. NPDC059002]|uniref:ABC transporter ATP-binding protein n=1 Tax=Streptomyces sp. NPDC059002 TaxID=3346690 RepID=UPI003693C93E
MTDALSAHGITKRFQGRLVVDGVSMTLSAGSVTAFLGANGSGKTTTLRLMLGLLHGGGQTLFHGRPLADWRQPARIVGAVFGGVAGHPKHTVAAHLRMAAAGIGVPAGRVDEVLERVGLQEAAGRRIGALSLGMAQRAGIAQALLGNPSVLLLDEPANGLDPHSILWLRALLRQLAEEGRAVLVSSHLLAEVEQSADRAVVLARGRTVAETSIAELASRAGKRVTVQSPQLDLLQPLVREHGGTLEATGPGAALITGLDRFRIGDYAAEHQIPLHWIEERQPSLEDFYLSVAQQEFEVR